MKRTIANEFNQSEVKSRLAMMFRGKSKRKSLLKLLYLLPALLIAILLVAKFSKDDQKAKNATSVGLTVEQYDELTENNSFSMKWAKSDESAFFRDEIRTNVNFLSTKFFGEFVKMS